MSKFFRIAAIVVAIASFATTSQALPWTWYPSPKGYVARVQDGECHSLVTVFWSEQDYYGPAGWRIAFDKGRFENDLGFPEAYEREGPGAVMVMLDAQAFFVENYCGTRNYEPTCPKGSRPASQIYGCNF